MRRMAAYLLFAATLAIVPRAIPAQGGMGRGGGMGPGERYGPSVPKLPVVELQGPLDSALARVMLELRAEQATRYAQAYDSFMVATRPQRDSANVAIGKMNERLDQGDRAAALFYAERVQDLGKTLKDRQERFENGLRRWLSGDQIKAYRKWKEGEEQAAERKRREDVLRWQEAAFAGGGFTPRTAPESKAAVAPAPGTAAPELGAQAVRSGRTLSVTGQLGLDSAGALVAPDLRAQAIRAFANVGAVLQAAGAAPRDVTALTIYVVNYRPSDLAVIRDAGAAYFGANSPIATVVGVQSLARDGALIAVGATAVTSASPFVRER